MKYSNLIFFSSLFLSLSATAMSSPCTLETQPLPSSVRISAAEDQAYRAKLRSECVLELSYSNLKVQLSNYGVTPENLTEYQAMRFIRREDFNKSRTDNIPVEVTYQIRDAQYSLPVARRSSIIWDNWIAGIAQLGTVLRWVAEGRDFTFENLRSVHVGFFTLSTEEGDVAHRPDPGQIKPRSLNGDNYWWHLNTPAEGAAARRTVNTINAHYRQLGLLPSLENETLSQVLTVRRATRRGGTDQVDAIYSTDSHAVLPHLDGILAFINDMLRKARNNEHLVINNKLLTPAEAAFIAQKYYVTVHPFTEGNGRTSRFIQELMLNSFGLPHGSSGDLMDNDVLTTFDVYYATALQATASVITAATACLQNYAATGAGARLAQANQSALPYQCRILRGAR